MDDLYAKFLPRFITLARARVATSILKVESRDPREQASVPVELHTLAGEAGLLGLKQVVPLAQACEQKAKALHSSRADADAESLLAALHQLASVIEEVSKA